MHRETASFKTFFEPDDVFGDYTILKFCGRGAYGEVYLAEDITRKTIALKVIPILTGSEIWRMELIGLRHYRQSIDDYRSLIEVYHVGETEDFFYYTMEAADNLLPNEDDEGGGEYVADTLAHRLSRGGRLKPEKVLELAFALLDALDMLSAHDLAHRDLKPSNIVFVNGKAKLSDIGLISRTGMCGKIVGTADFLPPELADGDPVGYSNDLYALGKVLYCALTGFLPEHFPEVPVTVPISVWRQFKPILLRACAEDPRQRFYTSREFRKALPGAIHHPGAGERVLEELRYRYNRHPLRWRIIFAVGILAIAGGSATGVWRWEKLRKLEQARKLQIQQAKNQQAQAQAQQAQERQRRLDFIFRTLDDLRNHFVHLDRLSEGSGKQALFRQLEMAAERALAARMREDWAECERCCVEADGVLRSWAAEAATEMLSDAPETLSELSPEVQKALLKRYYDFTETPLFPYLAEPVQGQIRKRMADLKALWNPLNRLPTPGEAWQFGGDENLKFVYVAQGALAEEPAESYWIGVNEVTEGSMKKLQGAALDAAQGQLPAVNLSWNDRLAFCDALNQQAAARGELPAGMIYRLPTLQEWNFAFRGGWRSFGELDYEQHPMSSVAWFSVNSQYRLQPVRTRLPGPLGLYDMAGNAAETVLSEDGVVVCGASFRDRLIIPNLRRPCAVDEVESSSIGFRVVLGTGTREDLEKTWYTGSVRTFASESSVYELLGGDHCRWRGEVAAEWCRLLGGAGAMLKTPEATRELLQKNPRWRNAEILLGARRTPNGWQWLDGTALTHGIWMQNPGATSGNGAFLVGDHGFWRGADAGESVPWMMVEWACDAHQKREAARQDGTLAIPDSDLILKRFTHDGKKYLLIAAPVDWFTAKHLAELLGARLAMPTAPETRTALFAEVAEFSNMRIALGGRRFFNRWQWLDGTEVAENLPLTGGRVESSPADSGMAFHGGKLCGTEEVDAILCEIESGRPEKASSASLAAENVRVL